MYNTLKTLISSPSVSGREENVMAKISEILAPLCDEVKIDNMGNVIGVKYGNGEKADKKKVMLCGHADEIGFLVTFIEESGYIRVSAIGGINTVAAAYTEVVSDKGVRGVISVSESKKKGEEIKVEDLYIDIGAKNKKELAPDPCKE